MAAQIFQCFDYELLGEIITLSITPGRNPEGLREFSAKVSQNKPRELINKLTEINAWITQNNKPKINE